MDITRNITTLREASAIAVVQLSQEATWLALKENRVPKGNVWETAKVAGLLAVKRTSDFLPFCPPKAIEFTSVEYETQGLLVRIIVQVKSVYKDGVALEAMHGASVVALTFYDMLKPIDFGIQIKEIRLLGEFGDYEWEIPSSSKNIRIAILVCSDAVAKGGKQDTAGQAVLAKLKSLPVRVTSYEILPDDPDLIQQKVKELCSSHQLVICCGGTGLSHRDRTPEALVPILERRIPGMEEAIRSYGQQITPHAMFSRSVAGTIGGSLVLALPGSSQGARESMDAVFPAVLHFFKKRD